MVGVSNVGSSGGKSPSPSNNIGDFAALCRELISMDPKELGRIEKVTKEFHAAKAAADASIAEADAKMAKLVEREKTHAAQVATDTTALESRQIEVSARESRAQHRESAMAEADKALSGREQSVADGERRLSRVRDQLGAVG